jgi:Raf kinase inhibitor-like YbhB/YbcL family protein
MSEFFISSPDFKDGEEIPKKFGYKHGNETPLIELHNVPEYVCFSVALIMDDPDAMAAVGKVWVHWLVLDDSLMNFPNGNVAGVYGKGKNDFGELGYGGPAPPDGRHTYVFKAYALDYTPELKEGYSKQELEDAMKGHILAEAKLTGTFAP